MKLFVNGRFLTQRVSGVQSFAREICRELLQETELVILVPKKAKLVDNEFEAHIKQVGSFTGHLWEQIDLPLYLKKQNGSKLLNLCNTGPAYYENQIATIHDLAFIKNPSWFNPVFSKVYSLLIPKLARSSSHVITVSETVKNELINEYKIQHNKIIVIGNKVSHHLLETAAIPPVNKQVAPYNYFLMVGSNNPRKNFIFVERLFAEHNFGKKLVIVGGSDKSFNNSTSEKLVNPDIIKLDYINNEMLSWLYQNAAGMINPSLYEGFGIPNIEAMAFSCPVICSDIPVFKEICGNAAFYFDLNNGNSLKKCLTDDLSDKTILKEKIIQGKLRFAEFQNAKRAGIILNSLSL